MGQGQPARSVKFAGRPRDQSPIDPGTEFQRRVVGLILRAGFEKFSVFINCNTGVAEPSKVRRACEAAFELIVVGDWRHLSNGAAGQALSPAGNVLSSASSAALQAAVFPASVNCPLAPNSNRPLLIAS